MHTFAQKPTTQQTTSTKSTISSRAHYGQSGKVDPMLPLRRTIGNQAALQTLQNNARVAERVMRMPEPRLQRRCACGGTCADCQKEDGDRPLQMKRVGGSNLGGIGAPSLVHEVLRSPGQPLDAATRAVMEPRFRHDFSKVRVHTDSRANESAHAVNALAYTVGPKIVFGEGQYRPGTTTGRQLLAHELTHVVQQHGQPFAGHSLRIGPSSDAYEAEAERAASTAASDGAPHTTEHALGVIQRKEADPPAALQPDR